MAPGFKASLDGITGKEEVPYGSSVRACCTCKRAWVGVRRGKHHTNATAGRAGRYEPTLAYILGRLNRSLAGLDAGTSDSD